MNILYSGYCKDRGSKAESDEHIILRLFAEIEEVRQEVMNILYSGYLQR